jgi:hypothetical protein
MKRLFLAAFFSAALGCGGDTLPAAPSAVPGSGPAAPAQTVALRPLYGYVSDTAFRVVGGAMIEVVSGQHAGLVATTDTAGRFEFDQPVASPAIVRAIKDGYAVGTNTSILTSDGRAYVGFSLASLSPPVAVAGSYTLTITADRACTGLPDDVRTRTYSATIAPVGGATVPANTRFTGTVTGGQFAPHANLFFVGVFADYVVISTEGEGPTIAEHLGSNRYVAFSGAANASVPAEGVSAIAMPFAGSIEYCGLNSAIGPYYDCAAAMAAERHECRSTAHQLTLTRR